MSGSRWETTPSRLSGSLRPFLYRSPWHLFLISSASARSLHFYPLSCSSFMKYFINSSNFLEGMSSLSHSIVFLYFFAFFIISPCYSPELCIQFGYIFPFLPWFLCLFFPQLFVNPPQTTTLPSCISFYFGRFWLLPPVWCYDPLFVVFQVLFLPDLIPWIYLSYPLYSHRGFDLGHTWIA